MKNKKEPFLPRALIDVTILKPHGYHNWSHKDRALYDAREIMLKREVSNKRTEWTEDIERMQADLVSNISPR